MSDLAQIAIRADTSDLKDAKASLEALGPAAKTAEKGVEGVTKATDSLAVAAAKGATAVKNEAAAAAAGASNNNNLAMGVAKAAAANNNLALTAAKAQVATNSLTGQVGNLSAQFGDIAVQLAGGQSPFQIALQQGLQLIGVFGNAGLGSIVKGLGGAFLSLVSPVALLTIGIITLGGYVVQYLTEWLTKGSEANLKIEEQQALIRGLQEAWGTGIPAIDAYIAKLDEVKTRTDALAAAKILSAEIAAPSTASIEELNVEFAALQQNLQQAGADYEVLLPLNDAFQNLRDRVAEGKATQEDFNAVLAAAQPAGFTGVAGIDTFIGGLNRLMAVAVAATGQINNLNAAMSAAQNKALNNPATFRGANNPMANADGPIQGGDFQNTPDIGPVPAQFAQGLDALPKIQKAAGSGSGGAAKATKELKTELELLNAAFGKLNEPFNQARSAFQTLKAAQDNGTLSIDEYTKKLELLKAAYMATGGSADQWAKVTADSSKKVGDAAKGAEDITKGFLSDLKSGLKNGEGFFEAFKNAGLNALDKLIDKLLNSAIDGLFSGGKSGGGFLSGIGTFFSSLFSAKGNAFGASGVMPFANGGAFTNSVVSKPTMFAFANGGALGVMGEAGAEAIMPLKRGADGSLGVQMHGAKGGKTGRGNITLAPVNQNTFVLEGAISEETVVRRVQAAAEQTLETTKKSMMGWIQQYNQDGAFS